MKRILLAFAMAASLGSSAFAGGDPSLPDRSKTPGDAAPNVSLSDICAPGYSAAARHAIPPEGWKALRRSVFAEYGIDFGAHAREYETDHLLPIELGGSNSIKNLWPQPWSGDWNARVKDRLENYLHRMVCPGRDGSPPRMPLAQAQQEIQSDWIAAYKKYIGPTPAPGRRRRRTAAGYGQGG